MALGRQALLPVLGLLLARVGADAARGQLRVARVVEAVEGEVPVRIP